MALDSSSAAGILRVEDVGPLILEPLQAASTAMAVASNVSTGSSSFRIPIVVSDAAGGWYSEGADINLTDADISEIDVTPTKCAVLSKISNELANDSSPAAAQLIGQGMARDLARRIDIAFFANATVNGPSGLLSLSENQTVDGGSLTDLDPFAEAISKAEGVGSTVTAFIASANDALHLSQLKAFDGATTSNQPLLSSTGDATAATKRSILGVPLHVVPNGTIADGTIWAVDRAKVYVVVRQDVSLDVDRSVFFGSDSLGIRAVVRVGFGFPHEASIVKIGWSGS